MSSDIQPGDLLIYETGIFYLVLVVEARPTRWDNVSCLVWSAKGDLYAREDVLKVISLSEEVLTGYPLRFRRSS